MQQGRVYRAAIPRGAYNDMTWNNRAPARLQLDGFVVWNGLILTMNTGDQAAAVWTALDVEFRFDQTFTGDGHTFTWFLRQRPWPSGEGAEIMFRVDDDGGGMAEKRWRWKIPDRPWGIVGFPEFSELVFETYTGFFLPGNMFLQPTCVVYALEP